MASSSDFFEQIVVFLTKLEQCSYWGSTAQHALSFSFPKKVTSVGLIAIVPTEIRWWVALCSRGAGMEKSGVKWDCNRWMRELSPWLLISRNSFEKLKLNVVWGLVRCTLASFKDFFGCSAGSSSTTEGCVADPLQTGTAIPIQDQSGWSYHSESCCRMRSVRCSRTHS